MFTYSLSGLEIKAAGETLQEVEENETTSRSALYQLFAKWFSGADSSHFAKSRDGIWVKELESASELLPYKLDVDLPIDLSGLDSQEFESQWSLAFQGSDENGSPLESSFYSGDNAQTIHDVQREYEYFGLATGASDAHRADHLSTELEFMGFLCFKEAATSSDRLRSSYRRAQADFLSRFLEGLVTGLVARSNPTTLIPAISWGLRYLEVFVAKDIIYLDTILAPSPQSN